MVRKYVCFIDVDVDTGEVNIEGMEKAPTLDYLSISTELLYQYEQLIHQFINNYKK